MNLFRNHKQIEKKLKHKFADFEVKPDASLWENIEKNIPEGSFESKMKALLDDGELEPSSTVWQSIESDLNDESGNRVWWKYATLLLVILGSLSALFYTNNKLAKQNNSSNDVAYLADSKTQIKNVLPASKSTGLKKGLAAKKEFNTESKLVNSQSSSRNSNNGNVTKKANTIVNTKKVGVVIMTNNSRPSIGNIAPKNIRETEGDFAEFITSNNAPTTSETNFLKDTDFIYQDKQPNQNQTVEANANIDTSLVNNSKPPLNNPITSDTGLIKLPEVTNDKNGLTRFSISMLAGINYCMMRLESPEAGKYPLEENMVLRRSIEQPEIDWAVQFLLNYDINKRWMLTTGFGRLLFRQSFYYNITIPETAHSPNESNGQMQNAGDSIVNGNAYVSNIRYSWTEIPIMLTCKFPSAKKVAFQISAGMSYAILSNLDVAMVNYDNVGILMLNEKESFPVFRNQIFTTISFGLNYSLNETVELSLLPHCKIGLRNMIENPDWVKQYPYFVGLNFGLRKKF
jgi:hypothetical protein